METNGATVALKNKDGIMYLSQEARDLINELKEKVGDLPIVEDIQQYIFTIENLAGVTPVDDSSEGVYFDLYLEGSHR